MADDKSSSKETSFVEQVQGALDERVRKSIIQKLKKQDEATLGAIIDSLSDLQDVHWRTTLICELVQVPLPKAFVQKVLERTAELSPEAEQARATFALARYLPEDRLGELFRIAATFKEASTLQKFASHVAARLKPPLASRLAEQLLRRPLWVLLQVVPLLLIFIALAFFCWKQWLMPLWSWGFDDPFTWTSPFKYIAALLGAFYLLVIPLVIPFSLAPRYFDFFGRISELQGQVQTARDNQDRIEAELLEGDEQRLVMLLRYSRQILLEYYAIAMSQAQKSYRNCLVAMWIGFLVLLAGILGVVNPLRASLAFAAERTVSSWVSSLGDPKADGNPNKPNIEVTPSSNSAAQDFRMVQNLPKASLKVDQLVLLTGTIIEFIAVAFLWMYRFSVQQQTYYYRRQLKLHNALLAHRMSANMTEKKADATMTIVESLLEDMDRAREEGPNSSGFSALLRRRSAAPSP